MSNPGVVYLAEKKLTSGKIIRIEDNIGEAIHIHLDDFRVDLTIDELLNLNKVLINVLNELINVEGFNASNFDPIFLSEISQFLLDLEKIEYSKIKLEDILVETKNFLGMPVIKSLKYSRVVKALNGDNNELLNYKQENMIGETNIDRLEKIKFSIDKYNYPLNNQYLVFFNFQNTIRDGQHRASYLYYKYGNIEIPVIRMHFKNGKYNTPRYPVINLLFKWNSKKVKRVLIYIYKKCRNIFIKGKKIIKKFLYRD